MRRLLLIVVTGALSTGAGALLNHAVTEWAPCNGERLACSIDGVVGLLAVLVLGGAAMLLFGGVLFLKPGRKPLAIAFAALMVAVAFLLYATMSEILLVRDGAPLYWREYQKLLQIVASPALTVVMQWLIFHLSLGRASASALA